MGRFRVYIKPFDLSGQYASDYTEISRDVLKLGQLTQALDNTEYDVGIFRNSDVSIDLRNDHGLYLEANSYRSIFKYKRADTLFKITWHPRRHPLKCGFFKAGECGPPGAETTVFEGLLSDLPTIGNINTQKISFSILGFESLLDRVDVPFSDISAGDKISTVIFKCLNQSPIKDLIVVDQDNIVPSIDQELDTIDDLENKTVLEAISSQNLLLGSNSVFYIKDGTAYVSDRSATDDTIYNFYGQAAINGIENIVDIKNYRDGGNRIFNYWTFKDTTLVSKDASSISYNGIRKKELDFDLFDPESTDKMQAVLDSLKTEFAFKKIEFDLVTPMKDETIALFMKDKVQVDYPSIYKPADENIMPRFGHVRWGKFRYPISKWALTISASKRFKIMARKIDPNKQLITLSMREV